VDVALTVSGVAAPPTELATIGAPLFWEMVIWGAPRPGEVLDRQAMRRSDEYEPGTSVAPRPEARFIHHSD
jgi:hypothetical protein